MSAEEGGQGIEASDADGCSQECQKREKCQYWTFVQKWKVNCYLKKSLGEKSDFEDGVSGTFGSNCGKRLHENEHGHSVYLAIYFTFIMKTFIFRLTRLSVSSQCTVSGSIIGWVVWKFATRRSRWLGKELFSAEQVHIANNIYLFRMSLSKYQLSWWRFDC